MATPGGTKDPDVKYSELVPLLESVPQEFDFFQAVRLFERVSPDREPVGQFVAPSREVVHFSAHASMVFPASAIQDVQKNTSGPPAMIVNFMGLTGPQGVLPLFYTQLIIERIRAKDTAMPAFLDIFNHRAISLFYGAWEKYRFPIAYERDQGRDPMSHALLHLIGIGTDGLRGRQAVEDQALLFYSGFLALHPRSSASLRNMLWDYFDVPVEIEQYVGAWYRLDESTQCRFDKGSTYSEQVGIGAIAGDEIWDQQSGVRIRLGPMSFAQYLDFLPNGSAYQPLKALVRFFGGDQMDFEVQLVLKREEVPACELGSGAQLAWSTWAKTAPMGHDASDTILRL